MTAIYFDHNATTMLLPAARSAMEEVMNCYGNASSIHAAGRKMRQYIEKARTQIAAFFNVLPAQVVFTSGATEANNLVIKGFRGNVITSAIEHDSVLKARPDLTICPVTKEGVINLEALEALLQKTSSPCLVSIMAANNETGVIQPLLSVKELCRQYGAFFHSDVVQIVGKKKIDWSELGLDYLSFSAHKIGGPQGVGVLIVHPHHPLQPLIHGGGQERYFRAGTENVIGIVGLGAAVDQCDDQDWREVHHLRLELEQYLTTHFSDVTIFGKTAPRLPNTVNLTMPGVSNSIQVMHFDLHHIFLSAGSACSSGKVKPSHVLQAMGVDPAQIETSIRISFGVSTTTAEIERFIEVWEMLYDRTHSKIQRSFNK